MKSYFFLLIVNYTGISHKYLSDTSFKSHFTIHILYEILLQLPGLQLCFFSVTVIVHYQVVKRQNYKLKIISDDKSCRYASKHTRKDCGTVAEFACFL